MSDSEPAGRLTKMPGMVEAAATKPIKESGVPKARANGFNTGFLDIVELRMAKRPTAQRTQNRYPVPRVLDVIAMSLSLYL